MEELGRHPGVGMTTQHAAQVPDRVMRHVDDLEDEFRRTSHLLLNLDRFAERVRAADPLDQRLARLDPVLRAARRSLGDLLWRASR